jgi:ATP-binding cassette subfamily B protein
MSALGIPDPAIERMLDEADEASETDGWGSWANLDAAIRMVSSLVDARAFVRGPEAQRVVEQTLGRLGTVASSPETVVPDPFWSVRPAAPLADGEPQLLLRGGVFVCVQGPEPGTERTRGPDLSRDLVAALEEEPSRPARVLWQMLRSEASTRPGILLLALALAAGGVTLEAVLFRALFEIGQDLGLGGQRLAAMGAIVALALGLLVLELPVAAALLQAGRKLEAKLRIAFLRKLPRLGDRYFRSRLTSDMSERIHVIHSIRTAPDLAGQFLRRTFELALTTAGIIWIDPKAAPLAILGALLAVAVPLASLPVLIERDLRVRSHSGALSRFYLDALLGLVPIRTHGGERAMRRGHESLLLDWARAGVSLQRAVVGADGAQQLAGFAMAAWILTDHLGRSAEFGGVLLLAYWALNLPVLGQEIAVLVRQAPMMRSHALRLLEPLGAPEEGAVEPITSLEQVLRDAEPEAAPSSDPSPVTLRFRDVSVRAAGRLILENLDLEIGAGSHVAIVGSSGAGKSSFLGLLLGWHRPASGDVEVDGAPLDGAALERLRRATAWVDPAIQIWNDSLLENLRYGADDGSSPDFATAIDGADLRGVLESLPDGLETRLGEGGALVSGGEGQRVRFGRAMLRARVQLALLDEPFRGIDRESREDLLRRARIHWKDATLLAITHDVSECEGFDRVLVLEKGRLVEDGAPSELLGREGSRFRRLLEVERDLSRLWSDGSWRSFRLEEGRLADA